ncbi:hypothetical protein ACHWQZ_G013680 [Mnemiopsis leidyi]
MNTPIYPQISISLPFPPTSATWRQEDADSAPNYQTTLEQNYIPSPSYHSVYYTDVRVPHHLDTDHYIYSASYQDDVGEQIKPSFQQLGEDSLPYGGLSGVQENYPVQPAITTSLEQIPISIATPSSSPLSTDIPVSIPSSTYLCPSSNQDGYPYTSQNSTSIRYNSPDSARISYTTYPSRHMHVSADSTTPDPSSSVPSFHPGLPTSGEGHQSTLMSRTQPISYQHPTFHPTADSTVCTSTETAPVPMPIQHPIDPNFPYHLFEYPAQATGGGKAKKVKKRTEFSSKDLKVLETAFAESDFARGAKRDQLATTLGVSLRSITVWFQNKRAKLRKEKKRLEMLELAAKTGIVDGVDLKQ